MQAGKTQQLLNPAEGSLTETTGNQSSRGTLSIHLLLFFVGGVSELELLELLGFCGDLDFSFFDSDFSVFFFFFFFFFSFSASVGSVFSFLAAGGVKFS